MKSWSKESEDLLDSWKKLVHQQEDEHRKRLPKLKKWNFFYSIFINAKELCNLAFLINIVSNDFPLEVVMNMLIGSVVVLSVVGVVQGANTTINPEEKYNAHLNAAKQYSEIERDITGLLSLPTKKRGKVKRTLKEISSRIGNVMEDAPDVNQNVPDIKKSVKAIVTDHNYQWQLDRMEYP